MYFFDLMYTKEFFLDFADFCLCLYAQEFLQQHLFQLYHHCHHYLCAQEFVQFLFQLSHHYYLYAQELEHHLNDQEFPYHLQSQHKVWYQHHWKLDCGANRRPLVNISITFRCIFIITFGWDVLTSSYVPLQPIQRNCNVPNLSFTLAFDTFEQVVPSLCFAFHFIWSSPQWTLFQLFLFSVPQRIFLAHFSTHLKVISSF